MGLTLLVLTLQLSGPQPQPGLGVPPFRDLPPPAPAVDVVPGLLKALGDLDAGVRQNAALALAEVGQPAVASLQGVLADKEPERRAAAAYALGSMGAAAAPAKSKLLLALEDTQPLVRRQAALALGRIAARERDDRNYSERPAPAFPTRGGP